MTKAKENFGKITEIQQEMLDKFTENSTRMMEMLMLEEADTKKGQEIWNEFFKRSQHLMEEQLHPDNMEKFWEKMPEQYNKSLELQMDFYNRTTEYMRHMMEKYTMQQQQEYMKKMTHIYMDSYNAWMESSQAGFKAMQEFFAHN